MPQLSRDEIIAVSNIRKYNSQPELPVLPELVKHTGDLSNLSPEELTFVLDCLLRYLHQQWLWQFHIAKNGHMNEFATVCKHIIDCGAIIDRLDVYYNDVVLNPCGSVWRSNEKQLVKLFLSAGASISISRFGSTPLHDLAFEFTADNFDDEAIQLLQDAGVDINAINGEGRTVLDIAARPNMRTGGSEGAIRRLKALGARDNEAHER